MTSCRSRGSIDPLISGSVLRTDFRNVWATERGLQIAAEIVLDSGTHILSAHFGESARDYEDVITQLAARAVIDEGLRARLKGLGGFRNVLVHGYLELDPDRVADHLAQAPADFTEFLRAIRSWLATLRSSGSRPVCRSQPGEP